VSRPVSRAAIVAAILDKDLLQYSRDKVYLVLTLVGLIVFATFFWIIPDTVEETIVLGVHHTDLEQLVEDYEEEQESEGIDFVQFESEEQLKAAVAGDVEVWRTEGGDEVIVDRKAGDERPDNAEELEIAVGIAFPENFKLATAAREKTTVVLYSDAAVPPEIKGALSGLVRQIAYGISGAASPVTQPEEQNIVIGVDRTGDQVSIRDKMRPMLAFFVLMLETFSLASLISNEVSLKTITAVLVTPAKLSDVLTAKTIYGTTLALVQAVLLLAIVDAFTAANWWLLLLIVLMGAVMFTGIGMIIGAAGRDFMGTLFYGVLLIVPLTIPAVATLFPGTAALWVQVLPTYGIVQSLNQVVAYGAGLTDVALYLGIAAAWLVVLYLAGLFTLKRKVLSL